MSHMATRNAPAESADNRHKLAKQVRDRRLQLGMSVRSAADGARVARGTWTSLEEGIRRTADNNYAGIEAVLQWEPGSIAAILAGGDPQVHTRIDLRDDVVATDTAGFLAAEARSNTEAPRQDEALIKVMRSDRLTEDQKRDLAKLLIAEREAADRQRAERADEMIRIFGRQT
jgi:hypothetical protein